MTDIATTLAQARAKLAAWQAEAATAAASGAAQAQTADAAWDAVAAIEAATAHAEGLRTQILARNDTLAAALAARTAALADAEKARSDGASPPWPTPPPPPCAPPWPPPPASHRPPSSTAPTQDRRRHRGHRHRRPRRHRHQRPGRPRHPRKQAAGHEDKEALAEAALTAAEAAAAIIADDLDKALIQREAAATLAAAGNKPGAVLAYVDYQAARARLTAAAAAAATKLQTDWNTARDAQLSAAADLLAAQVAVIQGQLALARKRAEMMAKLATRDAVATAAVDAVLNPPPRRGRSPRAVRQAPVAPP
jgi:hypothetical protein